MKASTLALAAAITVASPSPAHAGDAAVPLLGGLLFGTILGGAMSSHSHHHYAPPPVYYYPAPPRYAAERRCDTVWFYDRWGYRRWEDRCYWVSVPVYDPPYSAPDR